MSDVRVNVAPPPAPPSPENTFRAHLCAQEQELCDLKASVQDLSAAKSVKEKASREAQKLKVIVASQEEQVRWRALFRVHSCKRCGQAM